MQPRVKLYKMGHEQSRPETPVYITRLPPEMVEKVAEFLPPTDKLTFRLTCRDINAKCIDHIGKTFFKTMTIILTREALQMLVALSQSRTFSSYVKKLELVLDFFYDKGDQAIATRDKTVNKMTVMERQLAYDRYYHEQKAMKKLGLDEAYITKALTNFRSLQSLRVTNICGVFLCGHSNSAWGEKKVIKQTSIGPCLNVGRDAKMWAEQRDWHAHTFKIVTSAVAASHIKLEEFILSFGNDNQGPNVSSYNVSALQLSQLKRAFRGLETMTLHIGIFNEATVDGDRKFIIPRFISAAPILKDLNVTFAPCKGRSKIFEAFATKLKLPMLKHIHFFNASFQSSSFITFLQQNKTIQSVTLIRANIETGSKWIPVFKALKAMNSLENLELGYLMQGKRRLTLTEPESGWHSDLDSEMSACGCPNCSGASVDLYGKDQVQEGLEYILDTLTLEEDDGALSTPSPH